MMIGKLFANLLGSPADGTDVARETESCKELLEFEDGDWLIINMQESRPLCPLDEDPLENLLIEHPSMSVYQLRRQRNETEDHSDEEGDSSRPVAVRRHISWRLAAWGSPLPCGTLLLSVQRARAYSERRKLSRSALHRQNLAKTRFSPAERRYGFFKQPAQRLYNY